MGHGSSYERRKGFYGPWTFRWSAGHGNNLIIFINLHMLLRHLLWDHLTLFYVNTRFGQYETAIIWMFLSISICLESCLLWFSVLVCDIRIFNEILHIIQKKSPCIWNFVFTILYTCKNNLNFRIYRDKEMVLIRIR